MKEQFILLFMIIDYTKTLSLWLFEFIFPFLLYFYVLEKSVHTWTVVCFLVAVNKVHLESVISFFSPDWLEKCQMQNQQNTSRSWTKMVSDK